MAVAVGSIKGLPSTLKNVQYFLNADGERREVWGPKGREITHSMGHIGTLDVEGWRNGPRLVWSRSTGSERYMGQSPTAWGWGGFGKVSYGQRFLTVELRNVGIASLASQMKHTLSLYNNHS